MDRGAWWATVHGVANNRTRLRDFRFHFGTTQYPLHCILLAPHTSPDLVQKEAYRNTRRWWPQLPSEAAMVFWHPPLYPSTQFLPLCSHRQSSYLQTIQVDTRYSQVQFSSKRNLLKRYCWQMKQQRIHLKNIQATPPAQLQKNKWPNQKMGQRTKQTLLQGRHTDG